MRPEPADMMDMASTSFPGAREDDGDSVLDLQWASESTGELRSAALASGVGRLCWRTSVLSSNPLKASSTRLPSASTSSISCRICVDVCSRSSSSRVSMMLI